MNLEPKDKYKLEYAEVGNLRRHYSTVRASLTTFALTVSLAAFANYASSVQKAPYLIFVGVFMLLAAMLTCFVFSYRCERANLYSDHLWRWFAGEIKDEPSDFCNFSPNRREIVRQMVHDEMNWAIIGAVVLIPGFILLLRH